MVEGRVGWWGGVGLLVVLERAVGFFEHCDRCVEFVGWDEGVARVVGQCACGTCRLARAVVR